MDKTTQKLANYIAALDFDQLPAGTIAEIKKRLIDAIGCGIGGYPPSEVRRPVPRVGPGMRACR